MHCLNKSYSDDARSKTRKFHALGWLMVTDYIKGSRSAEPQI